MPPEAAKTEKRVAKRKTHSKSRNGCFQCKQRHTKCNETHPRCANCIRLDIHCTWPARERFSTSYPTPPESHPSISVAKSPAAGSDASEDTFGSDISLIDLRLLHHWTSKTYKDMNPDPRKHHLWQVDQIEIAFAHPFLLRGFLALAAIHMASSNPHADRGGLLLRADTHMTKALETYRKNLEQPEEDTAIPMFLMSSVLVAYNLTSADLDAPDDPINAMLHCFRLVQGVKVVITPHREHITSSKAFAQMVAAQAPEPVGDEQIPEILRLKELTETKKTAAGECYTNAIVELHQVLLRTRRTAPDQDQLAIPFSWTEKLSEQFMHLISIHEPIAVLIFAHFSVVLAECSSAWALRGWPRRLVLAAQKLLMTSPELLHYLEWPLQIINARH